MDKFISGWWNCFNAFAIELLFRTGKESNGLHYFMENVLSDAGVTKDEIEEVLESCDLSDDTKWFLQEYLANKF